MALRFEGRQAVKLFFDLVEYVRKQQGEDVATKYAQLVSDTTALRNYPLTSIELRRLTVGFLVGR